MIKPVRYFKDLKGNKKYRQVNCKLTQEEFNILDEIRQKHKVSVSSLIRQSIIFYASNYK